MNTIKKGFTLIELLIVIAILGVLAVVVLVAINPVQQLARTRDSGRISSVSQLGHAVEAYYTSHNGVYPTNAQFTNDATNILVVTGELTQVPSLVTYSIAGITECDADGWCYDADTDSFALWAELESDTNRNIGTCVDTGFISYLSLAGRACITCAAPGANTDDTVCQN